MPFLIPILLLGAVGFVVYEAMNKSQGASASRPALPPGQPGGPGHAPALPIHLIPISFNPGSVLQQPAQPSSSTGNAILQTATGLVQTTQPAGGAVGQLYHEVILQYLNSLVQSPTPQTLAKVIAEIQSGNLGPEGDSVLAALQTLATNTHAGFWGGVWGEDRMAGTAPPESNEQAGCNCITPEDVATYCAIILAQAVQNGGLVPAGQPMQPAQPMQPMQMPAPVPAPGPAPQTASATGAMRRGGGMRLAKGTSYFVSYPAGAKLSTILWEPGTVADAAASPTKMVADPSESIRMPTQSVPQSAPPQWLAHFGPGRAIAVMTWIGPDGGSDPGVAIWGIYAVGAAQRAA
jgi:hypothetical protein